MNLGRAHTFKPWDHVKPCEVASTQITLIYVTASSCGSPWHMLWSWSTNFSIYISTGEILHEDILISSMVFLYLAFIKSDQRAVQFSLVLVQLLSHVRLLVSPWIAACHASLPNSWLPEFTQTHAHRVGDATQPSHPLSSPSPPAPNPSQHQGLFQWVNSLHEVAKLLEFQLQHQSLQWTPTTYLLQMDWLDLPAVQGTLKSLLQHHSSEESIFWCSACFTVQLSHPYMTTGKTIALIRWTFVGKVMSLHFNMLSRLVITFLPRSKCLLISWLQSPSAVILEPKK